MSLSPLLGLIMEPLDVGLELVAVNAPDAPASDLDRGQAPGPDQRVDLGNAHAQIRGDVLEGQEPRLHLRTRFFRGRLTWHGPRIPTDGDRVMDLMMFATV